MNCLCVTANPCRTSTLPSFHQRKAFTHRVPARLPRAPRAVEEAVENPFFNDAFKSVLASALSRQDEEPSSSDEPSGYSSGSYAPTPYSSFASAEEEEASLCLQEEVLRTALGSSRATLTQLKQIQAAVERAIEREEKQVERIEFAVQKARTDAAYYATLEKLNRNKRRSWRDI